MSRLTRRTVLNGTVPFFRIFRPFCCSKYCPVFNKKCHYNEKIGAGNFCYQVALFLLLAINTFLCYIVGFILCFHKSATSITTFIKVQIEKTFSIRNTMWSSDKFRLPVEIMKSFF